MRFTVNCSILFADLPLAQRLERVADAGFTAVEMWWPFDSGSPGDAQVARFVQTVQDSGLRLTGLNFAGGDLTAGERGLLSVPDRSAEFRDSVAIAVEIGEHLGTEVFNALYGPGTDPELAVANLADAARDAARIGARVVLEPLSGNVDNPLRTLDDAAAVCADVTAASPETVWLLADLYHLAVNGVDLSRSLAEHAGAIAHVQLADAPGRGAPGTGTIDFATHLAALAAAGYDGWCGLEYTSTAPDPFGWLASGRPAGGRTGGQR